MRGWKWTDLVLVMALLAFLAVLLLGHAGIRLGTPFFGGDTGIFDAAVSLLTLFALIAGGIGAFVSYKTAVESLDATRNKDRWEQFRAGVQMLAANTDAEAIAGIEIVTDLTETQPEPFERIGFHVLRSYVNELSAEAKEVVWDSGAISIRQAAAKWPRPDVAEVIAFIALGSISTKIAKKGDKDTALVEGRSLISNILLVGRVIYKSSFQKLHVDRIALEDVTFQKCDFAGAKLVGRTRSVVFDECDLTDAVLNLESSGFVGVPPVFNGCKTAGATLNGESVDTWIQKSN